MQSTSDSIFQIYDFFLLQHYHAPVSLMETILILSAATSSINAPMKKQYFRAVQRELCLIMAYAIGRIQTISAMCARSDNTHVM